MSRPRSRGALRKTIMLASYLAGDTYQVIGDRWGVSRERVRQIIGREARAAKGAHRVAASPKWEPFDPRDPRWRAAGSSRSATTWRAHRHHKTTRRRHLAALRAWVTETGRTDPTAPELLALCGERSLAGLAQKWGKDPRRPGGYRTAIARLLRLAGCPPMRRGTAAHGSTSPLVLTEAGCAADRARIIARVRDAGLGGQRVSLQRLAGLCGQTTLRIAYRWGYRKDGTGLTWRDAMARMRADCGILPDHRGRPLDGSGPAP